MTRSIDDMLADARARIRRLDPAQTRAAMSGGALLVDIRPVWQRAEYGAFPGALVIERNHLEWRLDPASSAHISAATDHEVEVVVACQEGYSSSLAAAALVELGLHRSADLAGGFRAWQEAGLPTEPAPPSITAATTSPTRDDQRCHDHGIRGFSSPKP
ncbi:MAG TPA: rhodanese-like domain-containing protein [Frankiaceae bacterium]|nr:rhodanese-like domain-containing protein [Frankiaceae bacterium]